MTNKTEDAFFLFFCAVIIKAKRESKPKSQGALVPLLIIPYREQVMYTAIFKLNNLH